MKFFLLLALCISGSLALTTCVGNCGTNDGTSGCQCNSVCADFGDCCSDYDAVCLTCADRCCDEYVPSAECHCNSECGDHGNCCSDFDAECPTCGGGSGGLTDQSIIDFSEELYALDVNSVGDLITINLTTTNALFASVDSSAYDGPTIAAMVALRDNYDSLSSAVESDTAQEATEKVNFLDAIFDTDVMIRTEEFMTNNSLLATGRTLREVVDEIFFTYYTRAGGPLGSNGFEHSFLGEIDDNSVKGYHNWVSFSIDESDGEIDYTDNLGFEEISEEMDLMMMGFDWTQDGATYPKPISSMWIGTSPEYELALYTVCFFHKPNSLCDVSANGVAYKIQTYQQTSDSLTLVGSAYPDIA